MAFSSSAKFVRSLTSRGSLLRHGRVSSLLYKSVSTSCPHLTDAYCRGFPVTTVLSEAITTQTTAQAISTYRVMDERGVVTDSTQDPQLSDELVLRMYEQMTTLREMDRQLLKAQRMGLISFYMTCSGEEATHFGSAAALDSQDTVYAQYREAGVLMWRGFSLDDFMNQCFNNRHEEGKGRQMPVHYSSKKYYYQSISSTLATQIPHAPGFAYGLKRAGSKNCVMCFFGDGAAQEGDAHAGMNFAAVLSTPSIFFCRNNGYAISTPVSENYVGDGIVSRAQGYGMEGIRVDGNDVLAIYNVIQHARKVAVEEQRPVLVEAISLRMGSHSTSDDQSLYQDMAEVEQWEKNCPILRLKGYLETRGLWKEGMDTELQQKASSDIKEAMQKARGEKKASLEEQFTDVYDRMPPRLEKQRAEMWEMINKYKEHYQPLLNRHES